MHVLHAKCKLQGISTYAANLEKLTFINKHLKDMSNKIESQHVSSQLGLEHPSVDSFHPVQHGFGHNLCQKIELIECMNVRRRSSIYNRTPNFPPVLKNSKRQNWFDDLIEKMNDEI